MNEKNLIDYYNKFNEDKRLNSRHGIVEYTTSLKYIHEYLKEFNNPKILDIGAGCGKYSIKLADEGYEVCAVELVKHNIKVIEKANKNIKLYLANAIDLKKIDDSSYDLTLLFGPMYHLISEEEKLKALSEAKRVTKNGGIIMIAYCMNDYAIIKHGFMENKILESINNNELDNNFHVTPSSDSLYSYLNIDDINALNKKVNLKRIKIISTDGAANYIRNFLNKMDDLTFKTFINYHLSICERNDLIGAGAHTLDILRNTK